MHCWRFLQPPLVDWLTKVFFLVLGFALAQRARRPNIRFGIQGGTGFMHNGREFRYTVAHFRNAPSFLFFPVNRDTANLSGTEIRELWNWNSIGPGALWENPNDNDRLVYTVSVPAADEATLVLFGRWMDTTEFFVFCGGEVKDAAPTAEYMKTVNKFGNKRKRFLLVIYDKFGRSYPFICRVENPAGWIMVYFIKSRFLNRLAYMLMRWMREE